MLIITLPSGRNLVYVKPKIGMNRFGGQCITYEGVGSTKKWERDRLLRSEIRGEHRPGNLPRYPL